MNYSDILAYAKQLRINQTEAEATFWGHVRNRRFHGFKFTRQYIIEYKILSDSSKYFIVDFYCHVKKLIIEIDGEMHKYQIQADKDREDILNVYGYKVIIFQNEEILENWNKASKKLLAVLESLE